MDHRVREQSSRPDHPLLKRHPRPVTFLLPVSATMRILAILRTLFILLTAVYATTATVALSAPAGEAASDQDHPSVEQPDTATLQPSEEEAPKPVEPQSGLYEHEALSAIVAITENGDVQGYLSGNAPSAGQPRCDIVFTGHADGVNPVDIDTWRPWRSDGGNQHIGGTLTPTASGMVMKLAEGTPYTGCEAVWQTITSDFHLTLKTPTRWLSICRIGNHRAPLRREPNADDSSYASLGAYSFIGCGERENDMIFVQSIMHRNDFRAAGWVRISDINDRVFGGGP